MRPFDYLEPTSVEEVLAACVPYGPEARLLAGGQTLLILMRLRLVSPDAVIALRGVDELRRIEALPDGAIAIGAMATYREVASSPAIGSHCPILARVAGTVGSMHIRELGTVGGSIAHADPAADVPAVMMALDAVYDVATLDGPRTYAAADFVTGLLQTRIASGSLLSSILIPPQPPAARFGYARFSMRDGEYPMAQAAVRVELEDGTLKAVRLAVGGAGDRTARLPAIEEWLVGATPDDELLDSLKERVRLIVAPYTDVRGSAEWKAEVIGVIVKRALADALHAA